VDQVQVEVIQLQRLQACVQCGARGFVPELVVPDFGRDENVLARHTARGNASAHACFIVVHGGGVDVAIAAGQAFPDDGGGNVGLDPPGAQADARGATLVVKRNKRGCVRHTGLWDRVGGCARSGRATIRGIIRGAFCSPVRRNKV